MKRLAYSFVASICLLTAVSTTMSAQSYSAPAVTVTKDKVKAPDGKVYYSHVVTERQTLFSIAKAYNVTLQEIYDSNKYLNLETEGLKKEQILLIPVKENPAVEEAKEETKQTVVETVAPVTAVKSTPVYSDQDYITYKVKWYDDLDAIAAKHKVSKKAIMNFNGMTSEEVERKQVIKIPRNPAAWENVTVNAEPEKETVQPETVPEVVETIEEKKEESILDDLFIREGNHDVAICLALPFSGSKGRNEQIYDFYSGALLAAEKLGKQGVNIDLSVYDVSNGAIPITHEKMEASQFVIGPVGASDIRKAVGISDGACWIVSPLDPKAEALVDTTAHTIQAPASASKQIEDMISWIKSDMGRNDRIVLITEKNAKASSYNSSVISAMANSGLEYSTCTFGVMEVKTVMTTMQNAMTSTGCNRVVIASDNKTFVVEAVKNLYLVMNSKKLDAQLYATTRLKSFEGDGGIAAEQLHALNLHMSGGYLVNYQSADVKAFLHSYRALFNAEPSPSAFQGYDLMKACSTLANKYGNRWERRLDRVDLSGLQSDMNLVKTDDGSYINTAVRRVIYKPDFTLEYTR